MKNILIYIKPSMFYMLIFTIAIHFSSCSKFLEEYSQDERVAKDVREFSEILYGDAYIQNSKLPYEYLDLLTDDVKAVVNSKKRSGEDTRNEARGYFIWDNNPELSTNGTLNSDRTWATMYKHILTANVVLSNMNTMTGSKSAKAQLEGECHAVKLFAYFMLTNIYASPYDKQTAKQIQGIPINNNSYAEDKSFPKASIYEDYQVMISELESALDAFSRSNEEASIFKWNANAVAILGSRIYLYMKDYDNAIKYANIALSRRTTLYDLNSKNNTDNKSAFLNYNNKEIAFSYGFYQSSFFSTENKAYFAASDELLNSFTDGDLRYYNNKGIFISTQRVRAGGSWLSPKYEYFAKIIKNDMSQNTRIHGSAIRTAEALLNRAEAYAESNQLDLAMKDLNTLAQVRYSSDKMPVFSASSQEEAIKKVRAERRKELLFEYHRWFDLRRWDQPSITHRYITNIEDGSSEEYVLKEHDPRYTLAIPQLARESDPALASQLTK